MSSVNCLLNNFIFIFLQSAATTEPYYAYERQFTRLHMQAIFAEPAPTAAEITA